MVIIGMKLENMADAWLDVLRKIQLSIVLKPVIGEVKVAVPALQAGFGFDRRAGEIVPAYGRVI